MQENLDALVVEDHAASLAACDRLLGLPDLPESYREQTRANRAFAVARLDESAAPALV
ncbi:hypothetical protein [Streptomyces sp. SS]|uniref:hypothetical protein n=1 Tax=Streptomyces sp. SS TaxID=260742 RepID=UPI0002D30625|nr:hypothetical protein [Streptomyces sp. SS]